MGRTQQCDVQVTVGVADGEELLDVVCPCQAVGLAATGGGGVPVVVDRVLDINYQPKL